MDPKIFVTGDTHIPIDVKKLNSRNFLEQRNLTKDDFVIVAGDFGLLWEQNDWSKEELYWKKWFDDKNFTTLFIDGNHENYDRLNSYPVEMWNGGKVHIISDSIIHLMRGQIYSIGNKSIFTFGGARSTDRGPATGTAAEDEGLCWWVDEMPTLFEMEEARRNLEMAGNKVDYIITHTLPSSDLYYAGPKVGMYAPDYLNDFLQDIKINTDYRYWYAGHFHYDKRLSHKLAVLYNDIFEI